jgi:hypothetical protein
MKLLLIAAGLAIGLCGCAREGAAPTSKRFELPEGAVLIGNPVTQERPVPLSRVQQDPTGYLQRAVFIGAVAEDVCQAKGCWMTVKDQGSVIWVRWASGCGGEFAFPKDVSGKRVLIEGTLSERNVTPEEAAHIAGESKGMSASEIAGKTFEIEAVSCVILSPPA